MFKRNINFTSKTLCFFITFAIYCNVAHTARRPFYIIGHMVNSIGQIQHYLDLGSNVIESDVQFYPNGTIKELYHGFPCDCFRTCTRSVKLPEFLRHINKITNPLERGNYAQKMVMQFFDLKLSSVRNHEAAGRDLARHILEYLWADDENRKQRVRALVYIESVNNLGVIRGFLQEFSSRGKEDLLKDVGFDGGTDYLEDIQQMFRRLNVHNIWQGDGKTNCVSVFYPDGRLRRAVGMRENENNSMKKVYHWTIDLKLRMRLSLNLGIDGMITNDPDDLVEVLEESYYRNEYRIATPDDDPFTRFSG